MFNKIVNYLKQPILFFDRFKNFISFFRKNIFRFQSYFYGGKIIFLSRAYFYHPVKFQGSGTVTLEDNVHFGYSMAGSSNSQILFQPRNKNSKILIGAGTKIINGCELFSCVSITIGKNCLIGPKTIIFDSDFHDIHPIKRNEPGKTYPVIINDNVWIGAQVIILKGSEIGKDSVIGAGSVISGRVPDGSIVIGNPMRFVGSVYA